MSLLKSTFWYTFGLLLTRSINFILLPLYSNLLAPDEFGIYILIMSSYTILSVFYQGGLSAGFTKFFLEEKEEGNKEIIFLSVFNIILIISLILSSIGIFSSHKLSLLLLNSEGYTLHVIIAFGMLFFDSLSFYILHLLRTREQAKKVTYLTIISGLCNLLLNITFLYFFKLGILGILLAQLISSVILLIFSIPASGFHIKFIIKFEPINKILVFSTPLLLAGFFSTLVDFVDRYILDFYFDKSTVGIYSFSYRLAMTMNVFVLSYRTAWVPFAMKKYADADFYVEVKSSISKLVAILSLIFLCVSIFSDDLFRINLWGFHIFNEQYMAGIKIIPYILIGYAFSGFASIYTLSPYLSGKSYHFLYTDFIAFVINILFNFILIPRIGIIGAALATMISYGAWLIYLWVISRNNMKITYDKKNILLIISITLMLFIISNYYKVFLIDILIAFSFIIFLKLIFKINILNLFKTNVL